MNKNARNWLVTRVLAYTDESGSLQLWKRQEGFDVVVVENNNSYFGKFITDKAEAMKLYLKYKNELFKAQEEI